MMDAPQKMPKNNKHANSPIVTPNSGPHGASGPSARQNAESACKCVSVIVWSITRNVPLKMVSISAPATLKLVRPRFGRIGTVGVIAAPRAMGEPDHVHEHAQMAILAQGNVLLVAITRVNPVIQMHANGQTLRRPAVPPSPATYSKHARTCNANQRGPMQPATLPMASHVAQCCVRSNSLGSVGKRKRRKWCASARTAGVPGQSHYISVQLVVPCHLSGKVTDVQNSSIQRRIGSYWQMSTSRSSQR